MSFEERKQAFDQRLAEIRARYEPQIAALTAKGKAIADDYEKPSAVGAVVGIDFKVDWKDVELIFDVPSITIEDKTVSLDLPEFRSESQHIAFDVPDVRMVDRKVGEYPEFYGLTVKWSPIIISVPEPYMRRVDIYFDLPSVTMKRQEFILGLPKVTMERVRWVVGLPQFTVVNVSVKTDEIKRSGQALQEEATSVGAQLKQEIEAEVAKFTGSISAAAYGTKTEITNQYNSALGGVRSAIDGLLAQGCDPIKVPTDNGDVNLRKLYDEIDAGKARALLEVDHSAGIVG